MSNVITAVFCDGAQYAYIEIPIFQSDKGIVMQVEGADLPTACEVFFSNTLLGGSTIGMIAGEDGVEIPNALIETGQNIYAWYYVVESETSARTRYVVSIPVTATAEFEEGTPTPEQATLIEQAIIAINTAAENAEASEAAAEQNASDAEAWAVGQRDGVDVPKTDETYRNNSKYYAELSQQALAESGYITGFLNALGELVIEVVGITGIDVRVENSEVVVVYE